MQVELKSSEKFTQSEKKKGTVNKSLRRTPTEMGRNEKTEIKTTKGLPTRTVKNI